MGIFKKETKTTKDITPKYQGVGIVAGGSGGTRIYGVGGSEGVSRFGRGRGRTGGYTPIETYESKLLGKSFTSRGEMLKAEREYKLEQQRKIREKQLQRQTARALRTPDVKIKGGSVRIGTERYTGRAYIKELGMTASEYIRQQKLKAISEGARYISGYTKKGEPIYKTVTIKDYGKIRLTIPREPSRVPEGIYFERQPIKDLEDYDPRTQMFITPSPTGFGATGFMRPPTPEEQERIDLPYKYGGTKEDVEKGLSFVSEKVQSVLKYEPIKKTTTFIRDIPIIRKEDPLSIITKGGKGLTLGGLALGTIEKAEDFGKLSKEGWEDISSRIIKYGEGKEIKIGKAKFVPITALGYSAKAIGYTTKVTPKIVQYTTLGLTGGAALDIIATEEKKEQAARYVREELDKGYEVYVQDYESQKITLPEGYEMEKKLTKKEFEKKYGKEIAKDVMTGIKREQIVPFLLLTGGIAAGGIRYLRTPRIVKGSIRVKPIKFGLQKQVSVIKGEKITRLVKSIEVVKTPTVAKVQTPFGRLFGKEPRLIVVDKGQTYIKEAVGEVIGSKPLTIDVKKVVDVGKPIIWKTGRVGVKGNLVNVKFQMGKGIQKWIPKEVIRTLPKKEQYVIKSLIEQTKTGRPISYSAISKYIPEEQMISRGFTTQVGFPRTYKGVTKLDIYGTRTATIVKPLSKLKSGIKTFKYETAAKLEGLGTPRAIGKVDVSRGVIMQYPTIVLKEGKTLGLQGVGKKSSEQFLRQLYKLDKPQPIITPKIKVSPKITIDPTPKVSPIITKEVPRFIGGLRYIPSKYIGTGLYEVSEVSGVLKPPRVSMTGMTIFQPKVKEELIIKQLPLIKQRQLIQPKLLEKQISIMKPITRIISKVRAQQKQQQIQKIATKLAQKQIQEQLLKPITISQQISKKVQIPKPPITPKLIFPKLEPSIMGRARKILADKKKFEVFVTKFGKDISIGEFETLPQAKRALTERLRTTLRAGGFIKKEGKKLKARKLKLIDSEFRLSKIDPAKIIERKPRRIKKGTQEIREILGFRKSGRKRKGNVFGL